MSLETPPLEAAAILLLQLGTVNNAANVANNQDQFDGVLSPILFIKTELILSLSASSSVPAAHPPSSGL